jgi:hypothetical protein
MKMTLIGYKRHRFLDDHLLERKEMNVGKRRIGEPWMTSSRIF